jgi:hypothetical protein
MDGATLLLGCTFAEYEQVCVFLVCVCFLVAGTIKTQTSIATTDGPWHVCNVEHGARNDVCAKIITRPPRFNFSQEKQWTMNVDRIVAHRASVLTANAQKGSFEARRIISR